MNEPSIARFVPFILVLALFLAFPLLCRGPKSTVVEEASSVSTGSGVSVASEDFEPPDNGWISEHQVRMFMEVRMRARALRDEKLAKKLPTNTVDAEAAEETGHNVKEYAWVKKRVHDVTSPNVTIANRQAVSHNYYVLRGMQADLKKIGVVLPSNDPGATQWQRPASMNRAERMEDRAPIDWDYRPDTSSLRSSSESSSSTYQPSEAELEQQRVQAQAHRDLQNYVQSTSKP